MGHEIIHAIALIITITISFLFPKTGLLEYDLQIFAILFIILFLVKRFMPQHKTSKLLESIIFTFIIILVVNTTGGLASPFFFLLFFLLFSLSLLLEPVISITTTLTLVIFFLLTSGENESIQRLIPLSSLAFLTPFAMFMGNEHIKSQRLRTKNQKQKEDTFLFLSLLLKNHLKNIKLAVDNFIGDNELSVIKKSVNRMEKLIDKFENSK